jgi:hypothetical protein
LGLLPANAQAGKDPVKRIPFVLVLILGALFPAAARPAPPETFARAEVLVPGVYHMSNPGHDVRPAATLQPSGKAADPRRCSSTRVKSGGLCQGFPHRLVEELSGQVNHLSPAATGLGARHQHRHRLQHCFMVSVDRGAEICGTGGGLGFRLALRRP